MDASKILMNHTLLSIEEGLCNQCASPWQRGRCKCTIEHTEEQDKRIADMKKYYFEIKEFEKKYGGLIQKELDKMHDEPREKRAEKITKEFQEELQDSMMDSSTPVFMESEILDAMDDVAEQRRLNSRDPDWTPGDIAV